MTISPSFFGIICNSSTSSSKEGIKSFICISRTPPLKLRVNFLLALLMNTCLTFYDIFFFLFFFASKSSFWRICSFLSYCPLPLHSLISLAFSRFYYVFFFVFFYNELISLFNSHILLYHMSVNTLICSSTITLILYEESCANIPTPQCV